MGNLGKGQWVWGLGLGTILWTGLGLGLPAMATGQGNQGLWWSLVSLFRKDEDRGPGQPGGSRDPLGCLLTPVPGETLWSLSPLIAGQGPVTSVALRRVGGQEVLWQTTTIPFLSGEGVPTFVVAYGGPPLWPGDSYEWVIARPATAALNVTTTVPFRVMPRGRVRDRIAAELIVLGQEEARIPTAIARAQAQVFFNNQLITDALQVVLSPDLGDSEATEARRVLIGDRCGDSGP